MFTRHKCVVMCAGSFPQIGGFFIFSLWKPMANLSQWSHMFRTWVLFLDYCRDKSAANLSVTFSVTIHMRSLCTTIHLYRRFWSSILYRFYCCEIWNDMEWCLWPELSFFVLYNLHTVIKTDFYYLLILYYRNFILFMSW